MLVPFSLHCPGSLVTPFPRWELDPKTLQTGPAPWGTASWQRCLSACGNSSSRTHRSPWDTRTRDEGDERRGGCSRWGEPRKKCGRRHGAGPPAQARSQRAEARARQVAVSSGGRTHPNPPRTPTAAAEEPQGSATQIAGPPPDVPSDLEAEHSRPAE